MAAVELMGLLVAFSFSRDLYAVLAFFISGCRLVHVRETNRSCSRLAFFFLSLRCRFPLPLPFCAASPAARRPAHCYRRSTTAAAGTSSRTEQQTNTNTHTLPSPPSPPHPPPRCLTPSRPWPSPAASAPRSTRPQPLTATAHPPLPSSTRPTGPLPVRSTSPRPIFPTTPPTPSGGTSTDTWSTRPPSTTSASSPPSSASARRSTRMVRCQCNNTHTQAASEQREGGASAVGGSATRAIRSSGSRFE